MPATSRARRHGGRTTRPRSRVVGAAQVRAVFALVAALVSVSAPQPCQAGSFEVFSEQLPCANRKKIDADIAERVAEQMTAQPDLALFLRPTAPGQLEVRLVGAEDESRREIAFQRRDCQDLAETVALIVRAWVVRRWSFPMAAAAQTKPLERARKPVLSEVPSFGAAASAGPGRLLAAVRAGGFLAARADQSGLTAGGEVEWRFSEWGAAASGDYDAAVHSSGGRGSIVAALWNLGLRGRWRPHVDSAGGFDVSGGVGVALLSARSSNYTQSRTATFAIPACFFGARWVQRVADRATVAAGAEVGVTREEVLAVEGVGRVFHLSPVRVRVTVGGVFDLIE